MANSYVLFPGLTGEQTDFSIPFEYLSQDYVKATVGGTPVSLTFLSTYMLRITPAPTGDLYIYRDTPRQPITEFNNGSILVDDDLNRSFLQSLHIDEEVAENAMQTAENGHWDAENRRIQNVSDPVNPQDAVTKKWSEDTAGAAGASAAAASAAAASAAAAALEAASYVGNSSKLNGEPGPYYLDRTNHTGTQEISTVEGLQTALDGKEDADEAILKSDEDANLTAGYTASAPDDGVQDDEYTPTPVGGNLRKATNGGEFTFNAPTVEGSFTMAVLLTNNDSAGIVTFDGFMGPPGGDALTTTDGDLFLLTIVKIDTISYISVKAL